MINQELLQYIKDQLQAGYAEGDIKKALTDAGWENQDINEAFNAILLSATTSTEQPLITPTSASAISSLPSPIALLGEAWSVYKQKFWQLTGIMAIPALISMLIPILMIVSGGLSITSFMVGNSALGGSFLILLVALLIITAFSYLWGQVALLCALKNGEEGVINSYRAGWHKILPYFGVNILMGLVILGGFLLLLIPGIIFSIWFSLSLFVLIAEDIGGMNALYKSKEYVSGRWWGVLWRQFCLSIFIFIVSLIAGLIFNLLPEPIGTLIAYFIGSVILLPLMVAYMFALYKNLKNLKGESTTTPSNKEKIIFTGLFIIGLLIIPLISGYGIWQIISSFRKNGVTTEQSQSAENNIFEVSKTQPTVSYQDCGTSENCFDTAMATCAPAKVFLSDIDLFMNIENQKDNNCIVKLKIGTQSSICKIPEQDWSNYKAFIEKNQFDSLYCNIINQ